MSGGTKGRTMKVRRPEAESPAKNLRTVAAMMDYIHDEVRDVSPLAAVLLTGARLVIEGEISASQQQRSSNK